MTWRQLVKFAKKEYGLKKLVWDSDKSRGGACSYWDGTVYITRSKANYDFKKRIHVLFHELGHIYCYENRIWPFYHYYKKDEFNRKKYIQTGLKAERWVENWATKEAKKHFPRFKFKSEAYRSEKSIYRLKGSLKGYL